jgi:hypothetical protein
MQHSTCHSIKQLSSGYFGYPETMARKFHALADELRAF